MKSSQLILMATGCVAALALGIVIGQWATQPPPQAPEIAGIFLAEPRPVEAFELVDHDGNTFGPERFQGQWTFLYFGFTYCPDVCPMSLGELNQVQKRLEKQGIDTDNAYMLVSVDPQRDKPARLKEYTQYFNPAFVGATGEKVEIDKLASQFGAVYRIPPEATESDDYAVDHSSTITLINPDGELQAVFTAPHKPDDVVEGFERILSYYREHG